MKPFDLRKALAGEPVKLRDGSKAWVKYVMPDDYKGEFPLRGIYRSVITDTNYIDAIWTKAGNRFYSGCEGDLDILGMWEEPRPRVRLDLPCPLKAPQEGMWYLHPQYIRKSTYSLDTHDVWIFNNRAALENGFYFATKEDAQEWLDAMRNARK